MRLPRLSSRARLDLFFAAVVLFALAVCIASLGCATIGSSVTPRVGQEQAVDIVWHQVFGRTDTAPLVRWREGDQLECDDPESGKRGFWIVGWDVGSPDGAQVLNCREGLTWSDREVLVAWHGELSFAQTALSHELLHASLLREGIFIGHHERPDFFPTIDRANAALMSAGR